MAGKIFNMKEKKDKKSQDPFYEGEVYFSNPPKAYHEAQNLPQAPDKESSVAVVKNVHRRKNRRFLVMVFFVLLISVILSSVAISSINDVLAIGRKSTIVTVNIPENADTNKIIGILHSAGLVKQKIFCKTFMKFVNGVMKKDDPQYLSGVYYLTTDMGLEAMLNEVKSVQSAAETVKLVFPEGYTLYQIVTKLDEYNVCKADYLYTALRESGFNFTFVADIKADEKRTQKLEGYFFPDTYEFFVNENANSVINRLLENFDNKWTQKFDDRAKELGLTTDQVIIIASIIQKEAANTEQMKLISSVLHNRLGNTSVFPALECNATKDYVTKFVKPVIGEAYAVAYYKPYDTYQSPGLPPGPICNPGLKAIESALYPDKTDYLYFQHDKNGKIYMAKTNSEHNSNTLEVLRANNK